MSLFKCKMCGGTLEIGNETVATCEYCGTQQTLPKLGDDRKANLYDRANHFRRNNEFDKAMGIYEQILNADNTDAESYWSLVLCRYGIEYVEDPATHKRIPTVNRAQFTSIFDDDNYKSALQYADGTQRHLYEEEAKAINEIQKGILTISQQEEPFDVFICYKETDRNGRRTPDSVLANELYHQLTQEGFKVFFSRITLEDKLGVAYEPYIFAALNSAKVMVVLGTKPEYFNAVWVKNEWSRYLALIRGGAKKTLIPAYRDMDPYDLPEEFSHLQAQDMSKLGFMQDLIRGIKKITQVEAPKQTMVKETVITQVNTGIAPLLKRAFMFLEDGDWGRADEFCEQVLNIDPECAEAYLGKLMAELQVNRQDDLRNVAEPFDSLNFYQKAIRFSDNTLRDKLVGDIDFINNRNEQARIEGIYNAAKYAMSGAFTEQAYKQAAQLFDSVAEYLDSAAQAQTCYEKAEIARKDAIRDAGKAKMVGEATFNYHSAINLFESVSSWKDADEQIAVCQSKILEIEEKEKRAKQEKAARTQQNKRITFVGTIILCLLVFVFLAARNLHKPYRMYREAIALMKTENYSDAIIAFQHLDGYKDSADKIDACYAAIRDENYNDALALMENGQYLEAITIFETLDGYKNSAEKINECNSAMLEEDYLAALALMETGQYQVAIEEFSKLVGYKDSVAKITECETAILDAKYNDAVSLIDQGKLVDAYDALIALNGYKDSTEKANSISNTDQYRVEMLKRATVGDYVFFGSYEQDNNFANGKEDIEWLVLETKNEQVLVISKYALDCKFYNASLTSVTWENCYLRKWLNSEFLNAAFSEDQRAMIPAVTVSADKNPQYGTYPGNATKDQVFLLSAAEAARYLNSGVARKCKPTDYAVANGGEYVECNGYCSWWLRSPGTSQDCAAGVDTIGYIASYFYVSTLNTGVRPAMWIDLSKIN